MQASSGLGRDDSNLRPPCFGAPGAAVETAGQGGPLELGPLAAPASPAGWHGSEAGDW